jgi:hypothetical protein
LRPILAAPLFPLEKLPIQRRLRVWPNNLSESVAAGGLVNLINSIPSSNGRVGGDSMVIVK